MKEWLWVAWNLKGAPDFETWKKLDHVDRRMLKIGLQELIEKENAENEV